MMLPVKAVYDEGAVDQTSVNMKLYNEIREIK